jgi:prolyl oligopeptidase PreP (S9A serine peptidase family)
MKILVKKAYLKIYFFILNNLTYAIKYVKIFLIRKNAIKQVKKGYLNVYLNSDWLGLGARIVKTMELLNYTESKNIELNIKYGYKEINAIDYFKFLFHFKKNKAFKNEKFIEINDTSDLFKNVDLNKLLTINRANELFDRHLKIDQTILTEVDDYVMRNFKDTRVLGVHYRGTDKVGEAPRFSEDLLILEIERYLHKYSFNKVFISTDEQKVLEKLTNRFGNVNVLFRQDVFRSNDGDQIHRKLANPKEIINRDAITNILLLSRTDFLIKTASIMSDCCFIVNPKLKCKVLNAPHNDELTWWPAREINLNHSVS